MHRQCQLLHVVFALGSPGRLASLLYGLTSDAAGVAPLQRKVLPHEHAELVGRLVELGAGDVGMNPQQIEAQVEGSFAYGLSAPNNARPLDAWQAQGISLPQGRTWPKTRVPLQLVLPAGARGPAFLTTANFRAVLKYNASMAYALAVCLLSDRLAGRPAVVRPWPADDPGLSREERRELQLRLSAIGLETGGVDGVLGNLTRSAIRAYQKARGLAEDGHPAVSLLNELRRETRP
jgi:hypothetical protein